MPTCYTYQRQPLDLIFSQELSTREQAIAVERQIKGWSRRKKESLIKGYWAKVSRLARGTRDG